MNYLEQYELNNALPRVTIVTPAYNQGEYLTATIDSVLNQDYPNIEYIVIDDGSTDETSEILKRYSGRIRTERQENIGQARTLNKGWAMANGLIIGYLSSDDILYQGAVRKLVNILQSDSSIICTFPDADLIDEKSIVVKSNICRPFDLISLIIQQECYIGPGALFRRSAFISLGGWRPELKLAPDREFWIRLAAYGRFAMCDEVLAGYRLHPQSISYKDISEEIGKEYLWVLDQYFDMASIPSDIFVRKSEAYGFAQLLLARNCFRAGRLKRGWELYKIACQLHPPLKKVKVKLKILRNVISKPARIGLSAIRSLIKN